jgi:hypothetical protein
VAEAVGCKRGNPATRLGEEVSPPAVQLCEENIPEGSAYLRISEGGLKWILALNTVAGNRDIGLIRRAGGIPTLARWLVLAWARWTGAAGDEGVTHLFKQGATRRLSLLVGL